MIGLILGSTREGRNGEKVARWVESRTKNHPKLPTEFIDLKEWIFPPYPHSKPTKLAEKSYSDAREKAWVALVERMDGFIIVTPEYNHGYPAVLKNALDYAYAGWNRKPVAFVSYGGSSGGTRAVQQLRQVVVELQMAPIRDEVNIPFIGRAFTPEGAPQDEFQHKRLEALLTDLEWWVETLNEGRRRK